MASRALRTRGRDVTVYPDTTVYPEEERVGEESLQRFILELLRPSVEDWLAARGQHAFTGADQFIYFRRGDTRYRVAPDVFVLPGVRPGKRIRSWKTWREGIVPSFALEVVSQDIDKDYIDGPRLYDELGVKELIVFDPDYDTEPARIRFQVFRRVARRGLVRVLATQDDRVASKILGCHVVAIGAGETTRLRLGTGPEGRALVPTPAELLARARIEADAERAEKERERAARIALEAEVARLRRR